MRGGSCRSVERARAPRRAAEGVAILRDSAVGAKKSACLTRDLRSIRCAVPPPLKRQMHTVYLSPVQTHRRAPRTRGGGAAAWPAWRSWTTSCTWRRVWAACRAPGVWRGNKCTRVCVKEPRSNAARAFVTVLFGCYAKRCVSCSLFLTHARTRPREQPHATPLGSSSRARASG